MEQLRYFVLQSSIKGIPDREMMHILFEMLLDSRFDERRKDGRFVIANPDVAPLLFELLPLCSREDQDWILDRFLQLLSAEDNFAAVLNINLCCHVKPSLVDELLRLMGGAGDMGGWTAVFEEPSLMAKVVKIYELLTSQVLNVQQLKLILQLIQSRNRKKCQAGCMFFTSLISTAKPGGNVEPRRPNQDPSQFIFFDGMLSGLRLPELPCWPCAKGYSIVLKFKLENHASMAKHSSSMPHLFSFLDKDGKGLRLFLQGKEDGRVELHVQASGDDEQSKHTNTKLHFDENWQFLVVVHQFLGDDKDNLNFQIYQNGHPRWRGCVAYPNLKNPLPHCYIGNAEMVGGFGSRASSSASASPRRFPASASRGVGAEMPIPPRDLSRFAFCGRISTFCLLDLVLTKDSMKKVHAAHQTSQHDRSSTLSTSQIDPMGFALGEKPGYLNQMRSQRQQRVGASSENFEGPNEFINSLVALEQTFEDHIVISYNPYLCDSQWVLDSSPKRSGGAPFPSGELDAEMMPGTNTCAISSIHEVVDNLDGLAVFLPLFALVDHHIPFTEGSGKQNVTAVIDNHSAEIIAGDQLPLVVFELISSLLDIPSRSCKKFLAEHKNLAVLGSLVTLISPRHITDELVYEMDKLTKKCVTSTNKILSYLLGNWKLWVFAKPRTSLRALKKLRKTYYDQISTRWLHTHMSIFEVRRCHHNHHLRALSLPPYSSPSSPLSSISSFFPFSFHLSLPLSLPVVGPGWIWPKCLKCWMPCAYTSGIRVPTER
jgi:hypothetical protein